MVNMIPIKSPDGTEHLVNQKELRSPEGRAYVKKIREGTKEKAKDIIDPKK